ncbi:hypothetical protein F444_15318 [Phytophthora nicotianae P1976]|nr:hypothetical protein F444_15318 [Phytophthora nicotianae P1976]
MGDPAKPAFTSVWTHLGAKLRYETSHSAGGATFAPLGSKNLFRQCKNQNCVKDRLTD